MDAVGFILLMLLLSFVLYLPFFLPEIINRGERQKIRQRFFEGDFISAEEFVRGLSYRGRTNSYGRYSNDEPGCYVILIFDHPVTDGDYTGYRNGYVGQSVRVYSRVNEHLKGSHRPEIHRDYKSGRHLYICIIPCKREGLNDLETSLIKSLDWRRLYNRVKGDGKERSLEYLNGSVGVLTGKKPSPPKTQNKQSGTIKTDVPKKIEGAPPRKPGTKLDSLSARASQGDAQAQFELGLAYEYGKGAEQSYAMAAKWYWRAMEQNHPEATYRLSILFREGRGVTRDTSKAEELWKKAVQLGYR